MKAIYTHVNLSMVQLAVLMDFQDLSDELEARIREGWRIKAFEISDKYSMENNQENRWVSIKVCVILGDQTEWISKEAYR